MAFYFLPGIGLKCLHVGDIISFTVFGQVIVVLNSAEAATDLLVKKSSIYSDRPELPMLYDERL